MKPEHLDATPWRPYIAVLRPSLGRPYLVRAGIQARSDDDALEAAIAVFGETVQAITEGAYSFEADADGIRTVTMPVMKRPWSGRSADDLAGMVWDGPWFKGPPTVLSVGVRQEQSSIAPGAESVTPPSGVWQLPGERMRIEKARLPH